MKVQVREVAGATIVDLHGELVMGESATGLRDQIHTLLERGARSLAINLAGVSYIDSSGIGELVGAFTAAKKAGANINFFATPIRVVTILKVARLHWAFELLPDEGAAVSSLQAQKSPGSVI